MDPENPDLTAITAESRCEVSGVPATAVSLGELDAILSLAPCVIPAGKSLTISVRVADKIFSKDVTLASDSEFTSGNVKKITCRIDDSWQVRQVTMFSGGDGAAASPYQISCPADLVQLSKLTNGASAAGFLDKHYVQTLDIDMSGAGAFKPIGCGSLFTGTYDGGDHYISNLAIVGDNTNPCGLFSAISGAIVRNVKMRNCSVDASADYVSMLVGTAAASSVIEECTYEGNMTCNQYIAGPIVGQSNKSKLLNCSVKGIIKNLKPAGSSETVVYIGGVAGNIISGSTCSGCSFDGKVYAICSGVGGLAGHASSSVISDFTLVAGSEVSSNENKVGGVIGANGGSNGAIKSNNIKNCSVNGIIGGRGYYVGGIVGYLTCGNVQDCCVSSQAKVSSYKQYVGGVVGRVSNTTYNSVISGCAVYCDVSGGYHVGGIAGLAQCAGGSVDVVNCAYIGGKVYALNNTTLSKGGVTYNIASVGGIMGGLYGGSSKEGGYTAVHNCYSRPDYVGTSALSTSPAMGGVIGCLYGLSEVTACYSDLTRASMYYFDRKIADIGTSGNSLAAQSYGAIYGEASDGVTAAKSKTTVSYVYYTEAGGLGLGWEALKSAGCLSQFETFTASTAGAELVGKLNAGADAYNAKSPAVPAVRWEVGRDGYATLSGLPGDPSTKKSAPPSRSV